MVVYTLDFGKKKIIFSDEAHFDLGGYVNKKNCRIWGTENPTHPKRVTVWCGFWHNWAIFLRKWARRDRYSQWWSLSDHVEWIFVHKNWRGGYCKIWFQQDDAMCHIVEATHDILRPVFEDCIINRRADVVWPPLRCDLTPLDYYLWGAVKDKCYTDKPEKIDVLKDNIRKDNIGEIQLRTIDNVLKNWTDCIGYCMTSRGSHLNEIIFHY